MTNKQFEQIECVSKKLWENINNGHEYSMVTYTEFLGIVTEVWERLQENPLSEDLEEASKNYALNNTPWDDCKDEIQESFKAGAMWQKEQMMAKAIETTFNVSLPSGLYDKLWIKGCKDGDKLLVIKKNEL